MLKLLWKLKADANVLDNDEKSPLHIAAEMGRTPIVELLIDKFGASIRARTKDGSTMRKFENLPFYTMILVHVASAAGHADTALAFLKRGVPLHMPNKKGKTNFQTRLFLILRSTRPSFCSLRWLQ